MSFFDRFPAPDVPPQRRVEPRPAWLEPPDDVLLGAVGVEAVVYQGPRAAIAVAGVAAGAGGVMFELISIVFDEDAERLLHGPGRMHPRLGPRTEEFLRVGVLFEDGRAASNLGGLQPPTGPPPEIRLSPRGGGGGPRRWSQGFWLWPIPTAGNIEIVCEWPTLVVPETHATLAGDPIRAAAERARTLGPQHQRP